VLTWVGLIPFFFAYPPTSPAPPCRLVAEGDALHVITKTLVYVRPDCSSDDSMTREAVIEAMACEDRASNAPAPP
jgi:hypothetical protein